jgi:hypothetical protein
MDASTDVWKKDSFGRANLLKNEGMGFHFIEKRDWISFF